MTSVELTYSQLWLYAFVLTQAVETPLYTLALGRLGQRPRWGPGPGPGLEKTAAARPWPLPVRVFLGFLASLITHPVVWFVWPWIVDPGAHYLGFCLAAECFAVLTEAALLALAGLRRAFWVSLAVNAASVSAGLLSRAWFGLP